MYFWWLATIYLTERYSVTLRNSMVHSNIAINTSLTDTDISIYFHYSTFYLLTSMSMSMSRTRQSPVDDFFHKRSLNPRTLQITAELSNSILQMIVWLCHMIDYIAHTLYLNWNFVTKKYHYYFAVELLSVY